MSELNISYATSERKYVSKHTYQNVYKSVKLPPVRILRRPCGSGAASKRFYYQGVFVAPSDAEFIDCGRYIVENIDRKLNKTFKPKVLKFVGNVAALNNDCWNKKARLCDCPACGGFND